jgi:MoxR-like ATPase
VLGGSPRASEHLLRGARAVAALEGREYAIPDDFKRLAVPVLAHRLILTADAEVENVSKEAVVQEALASVEVPVEAVRAGHEPR